MPAAGVGSTTWNCPSPKSASTQACRFSARTTIEDEKSPSSPPKEPVTSRARIPRAVSIIAAADAKNSQWPAFDRSRKCTRGSPWAFGGSSVYTKSRAK